jgi:hypothetical protein
MVYPYNLVDGGGGIGTYSVPANYTIPWISVETASLTSIKIIIAHPSTPAGSFGGSGSMFSINDPDFVFPTGSDVVVVSSDRTTITKQGIVPGGQYVIRVRAYSGTNQSGTYGPYITDSFKMPSYNPISGITSTNTTVLIPPGSTADATGAPSSSKSSTEVSVNNASMDSGADDGVPVQTVTGSSFATSGNRQVEKSLFRVTNNSPDPTSYSIATKDTKIAKTYSHYSFGTGMFFQSSATTVDAAGGIGFFTDALGTSGYYVLMQTTSNLSNTADREVKILKIVNGKRIELNDSQSKNPAKSLTGILGATSYKVDIKVKCDTGVRVIDVYINNFKISAIDTDSNTNTDPVNKVLPITSNISMCATTGSAYYDYVYAVPLEESEYNSGVLQNVYNGQFNNTVLNFLYGEKVLSNFNKTTLKNGYLEEFGTVARELRKVNIKYESRPGYPLYPSLGINKFVNVLGSRLTSFGAEIYLINNAGTWVPLDDSSINSFSVIGNYLVTSGQHEYKDTTINEYTDPDPVVFESQWIQKESDAKAISTWIKDLWSKQQSVVTMQVFGNPLISVGDVITINYPSNNLDGIKKFVVMNVTNSFNQGLETSIVARTL